ncbi:MAG: Type toxin-antitoxin system VapB family antitoxin [Acidobacteriota bacterium]|nr:Type toxin-antitoxin system VapB family antitoxin [Acidobacteriota bacterium]
MRTTLNLPDALINDLVIETGERNKTRLIKNALEDMLRALKRKKILNMSGKMELDLTVEELVNEREKDMI